MKELLADERDRIRLDDYVTGLLRQALEALAAVPNATNVPVSQETFNERLSAYEEAISGLIEAVILIARWGRPEHALMLERIVSRLADWSKNSSGLLAWVLLPWHTLNLISSTAGSTALFLQNYWVLKPLFLTSVRVNPLSSERLPALVQTSNAMRQLMDMFKFVSGNPQHRVPGSEYFFARMRQPLDDLLFLDDRYESLFDEFEIFSSLVYADLTARDDGTVWALPGRFGYKFKRAGQPYDQFISEAISAGNQWPPLKCGFFRSSAERFEQIATAYRKFLVDLPWY